MDDNEKETRDPVVDWLATIVGILAYLLFATVVTVVLILPFLPTLTIVPVLGLVVAVAVLTVLADIGISHRPPHI